MLYAFLFEVFVPVFPDFLRQVVSFVDQKNELLVSFLLVDVLLKVVGVEEKGIATVHDLKEQI